MEYLVILVYLIFCILFFDIGKRKGGNTHYVVILILFVLVSGLAYRVGTDAIKYEEGFNSDYRFFSLTNKSTGFYTIDMQPFWLILNFFFYQFTGEWVIFKLCMAIFFNGTIFWFIKRHCSFPFTAVLLYFVLIYFEFNFESLRETFSICFMLIALDKFSGESGTEKNYAKYYLWVWPAVFFHTFGFISLFIPLFTYFKYNFKLIILAVAVSTFVFGSIESFFEINVLSLFSTDSMDRMQYYINSDNYGTRGHNINGYVSLVVRNIIAPLIIIKNKKSDNFQSLAITYVAILVIASFALIFYRLNNYLVIPMAIVIAESLRNTVNKSNKFQPIELLRNRYIILICLILMLSLRYSALINTTLWDHFYPYSSIYDKTMYMDREQLINR